MGVERETREPLAATPTLTVGILTNRITVLSHPSLSLSATKSVTELAEREEKVEREDSTAEATTEATTAERAEREDTTDKYAKPFATSPRIKSLRSKSLSR